MNVITGTAKKPEGTHKKIIDCMLMLWGKFEGFINNRVTR